VDRDLGLSVMLVQQVARGLDALGGDGAAFLEQVGAGPGVQGYVPGAQVMSVLDQVCVDLAQPNLGLALARVLRFGQLGFFEYCVATSPDVREALRRIGRFYGLLSTRSDLTLEEADGTARLVQHMRPGMVHSRHLTELVFARLVLSMHDLVNGPVALRAMRFAHAGRDAREHEELFKTQVSFGADEDVLEMDPAILSLPLRTSDPALASVLEQHATKLVAELAPRDPFLDSVRSAIATRLVTKSHALESTAADLTLPRRTLQRRLEERSTSYRSLVDSVRQDLAVQWLGQGSVSHAEIAYALGFSDPTAFYRAFRRWTGVAPSEFLAAKKRPPPP
jgi:AraC-like DNA-binding protein